MTMLDTSRGDNLDTLWVGIATHRCCRHFAAMAMICSPSQHASIWATNHPDTCHFHIPGLKNTWCVSHY